VDAISLHVTEPDEAREICGRVYFPHRLAVLHESARFAMSLSALNLGPAAVGLLGYAGEVCLETGELETGYEINVPLGGRLLTRTGSAEVCATSRTAALYRPDARARLHGWADGGQLFGLKVERRVLEGRLAGPHENRIGYDQDHKHGGGAGGQIEHHRFPAGFALGVDTDPSGARR
jgi:hypothetical protein